MRGEAFSEEKEEEEEFIQNRTRAGAQFLRRCHSFPSPSLPPSLPLTPFTMQGFCTEAFLTIEGDGQDDKECRNS